MFSYRHAFHAGNHADVLKHMVLLQICRYMTQKDKPITYIDTHAGVGLYPLNHPMAQKSGEFMTGIGKLWALWTDKAERMRLPSLLGDYLAMVAQYNPDGVLKHYPGSPMIASRALRPEDRLRIFELHPTDMRLLDEALTLIQHPSSTDDKRVLFKTVDGFVGLKANLPPPSRRGLVLIDPSYEIKDDYGKVAKALKDAMTRFSIGTYVIWYPVLARPESRNLLAQLERIANDVGAKWLNVQLAVDAVQPVHLSAGLQASGVFVFNPPYVLAEQLQESLPFLTDRLKNSPQGHHELTRSTG